MIPVQCLVCLFVQVGLWGTILIQCNPFRPKKIKVCLPFWPEN